MTGIELSLLISQLAGPLMSGLFGGGDQGERQSFEGKGSISPEAMMRSNQGLLNRFGTALSDHLATPVSLPSAYAQQPGAYSGGGLPMPIGLVTSDPALGNPSLLNRPGLGEFQGLFSGMDTGDAGGFPEGVQPLNLPGAGMQPGDTFIPGSGIDPDGPLGPDDALGNAFDNFFQTPFDQRTDQNRQGTSDGGEPRQGNAAESRGPRRRSEGGQLVRAEDLINGNHPGDDLTKALGSVQLLLDAYR